jgi:hypothetical protein
MAKDAFALSPITARAMQPSEEDYEAISEAFMETARGRWFLGEYAKRNRNADTHMVLDAVARIEQSLTAQKQPPVEDKLPAALAAIRTVLAEARNAASAAMEGLALEQNLAPVLKGARIMKEISWRWREIGADGRICDLIDQQVAAIESSCGQLGSVDPGTALNAAFDLIEQRLAQFGERGEAPVERSAPQKPVAAAASPPSPSPIAEKMAQVAEELAEAVAATTPETSIQTKAAAPAIARETAAPAAEVQETAAPEMAMPEVAEPAMDDTSETALESMDMSAEAADAHDESVLDMIALEMAIIDPADDEEENPTEAAAPEEASVTPAEMVEPEPELSALQETEIAEVDEPAPVPLQPVMETAVEPSSTIRMQPSPEMLAQAILDASPEPSLGSALVASGIIRKPISASDPLASLRRLTQAEKIALFS